MEVGETLLGFFCRTPIRHHKLGHEIKSGQWAGQARHFATDRRIKEVQKFFEGRAGTAEIATNFDHLIE